MSVTESASEDFSEPEVSGVVVGFDGSPAADIALRWGAEAAVGHGLPLTLLTARPDAEAPVLDLEEELVEELIEVDLVEALEAACEQVRVTHPDLTVRTVIHPDSPVEGLLAASTTADMIVIGSRGLGGFQGLLLGSTAMEVTPYAECPVVVQYVPDEKSLAARANARHPNAVVVAYDGSSFALRALMFAMTYADAMKLGVAIVYVSPGSRQRAPIAVERDAEWLPFEVRQDFTVAALVASAHPDVPVTYLHAVGRPAGVLISEAAGAPLAVVGTRGRGGISQLMLGSVGQQMLLHAECPMAMVHGLPSD